MGNNVIISRNEAFEKKKKKKKKKKINKQEKEIDW